ncbi:hypothetical protein SLS58_009117 [Diplodia intermedia]|uniref:Glutathione transferase n=1 Tax=Diplodia intermedia TaxID=856260 RepID=A0ABR3TEL4_9PEZI
MDHITSSPPQLRTLQPAALHSFQHPHDDRDAAHAFAAAAASGSYPVNAADESVLFQQPAFLQSTVPDRAIRSQRDPLPPALADLQPQHISPHQSNPALFHFSSPQDPPFAAVAAPAQPHARARVQIQVPAPTDDTQDARSDGKNEEPRLVLDPPRLGQWRERLFHVDETIVMTEDQFQTYWPHVDNIYSHRSTQRYKRKPFVSHYWDCRLKGRPPGTPKSDDPSKKKRKRVARERDLCDVKIKITEYEPGSATPDNVGPLTEYPVPDPVPPAAPNQAGQLQWPLSALHLTQPDPYNRKIYTIQRVNGNGANGKADGNPGPHKHDLEESDRIKKNTAIRHTLKNEKDRKKQQPRVWISLVYKDIPYQYIEVDPYKKPQSLLEVNPRGLVPALRHGDWGCYESTVLMEYLEDLGVGRPLMPSDPKLRANCRLWSDHINRHFIPGFYRFLQEQDAEKQVQYAEELKSEIGKLVEAADQEGPFFLGKEISFVDVQMAPWVIRLNRVLKPYRSWPEPDEGSRWGRWMDAIENDPHVQATTSTDSLYLDSYERYAGECPGLE